ncbi:MAG: Rab family GTPase [Promethearchaeati archaeon SRVP18_Atabeyarchaeia-1]
MTSPGEESYIKIIVAGEADVGKTALVNRYSTGRFDIPETIGIGFSSKAEKTAELGKFKFSILDMAGEERFRFILPEVCRGAKAVMLLFDLSNPKSFKNLGEWVDLIRECLENAPILLIGSKSDLDSKVPEKQIKDFVNQKKLSGYMKVSAKMNTNVDTAFRQITELIKKGAR